MDIFLSHFAKFICSVLMSEIIHFSATEANDAVFCRGSDRDISEQMCNTVLEKSMFTQSVDQKNLSPSNRSLILEQYVR